MDTPIRLPQYTRLFSANHIYSSSLRWAYLYSWGFLCFLIIINIYARILRFHPQTNNVLGATTEQPSTNQEQINLEATYAKWQSIIQSHPDYRDGYIELSRLTYMLNKSQEARLYIEKARSLDPNNEDIKQLLRFIL